MDTVANIWRGRTGLAKTYWLWGVLSGIPWGLVLFLVTPGSQFAMVTVLAFFMYYVIVHVGIWRSASQYQGAKAWAIFAKIHVAIVPICLVIGTLAAIVIPAMHQPSRQEPLITPATQSREANDKPPKVEAESSGRPIFRSEQEVMVWGGSQISSKLVREELELAHRYAEIWQARLIYDLNHDPIESLYIGYNVIIHNLLVNGLCRPQAGISGEISRSENGNIRFGAMDCLPIEYLR